MRWSRVCIEAIHYALPEERVSSAQLEERLAPLYGRYHLGMGQIESLTGVLERRFWPIGPSLSDAAAQVGRQALEAAGVAASELGVLIYGGVCRENLEPATACAVADQLGVGGEAVVMDHANACLGVLNGIVTVANMIELGQVRAGLVVSAESAREIGEATIQRMLTENSLETWKNCLASLTGGSGATAVLLTDRDVSYRQRGLLGGVAFAAPEHHRIARWGPARGLLGETSWVMETDGVAVLGNGVALGQRTWRRFLREMGWSADQVDKVICHQVGSAHQKAILEALAIPAEREFATYEKLGNIGTVSLPLTAAMADEAGFFKSGDRVGFLGIGTGLNCIFLGLEW
ncbi:MAG: 3-oxoacyl-ACP synthase III [Rickettsiales bacterium]|nr:3-oxoacyl-ACP synthase III [Rickettsiales bacterium]|tara:strand:+ start:1362 stop:2402 length:1041 start_codon:yes stop_codon:yes gene_type:complete